MAPSPLAGLDQRMLRRFDRLQLHDGACIGVAFSGGNDSLALAMSLQRCATIRGFTPILMHVDHRLRPSSGNDAKRAEELAAELELPYVAVRLEPMLRSRSQGLGIEQQARAERYQALAGMCSERGAELLATGHHLGDQAETVLMHLVRGAGIDGAAGMGEIGPFPVSAASTNYALRVWRPFLSEERHELAAYVSRSGLIPIEDESNRDLTFRRNAVRHEILPVVEQFFPGAQQALSRYAELASQDAAFLDQLADASVQEIISESGEMDSTRLIGLPSAVQSRVVRRWLIESGVGEPTSERVQAVMAFARSNEIDTHLEVGDRHWAIRVGDALRCGTPDLLLLRLVEDAGLLLLAEEDEVQYLADDGTWSTALWTAEANAGGARIRQVAAGDIWRRSGAPVRESLRRAGVHPLARTHIACLAVDGGVLAIPGLSENAIPHADVAGFSEVRIKWNRKEAG